MQAFLPTLILVASLGFSRLAAADELSVTSAHGGRVSVIAEFPDGSGPHPALVLAPGQGYHMHLPALEETSRALVRAGIAVFRFNWAYFTTEPKGRPSAELANELQDVQAVLSAARNHPKVDAHRVSVGGKSLGSVVAWRAFAVDAKLSSALLLTPICNRVPKGETAARSEADDNYPGFAQQSRPILFVSGDKDPLCAPYVLYRFAASGPPSVRVVVVGGDHSYEDRSLPLPIAEASRDRNIAAVAATAVGFVAESLLPRSASAP